MKAKQTVDVAQADKLAGAIKAMSAMYISKVGLLEFSGYHGRASSIEQHAWRIHASTPSPRTSNPSKSRELSNQVSAGLCHVRKCGESERIGRSEGKGSTLKKKTHRSTMLSK